ncbi:MAG: hypothetical protein HRU15_16395, partial [Planctomycetes bacterium]|nr:hypothetical protein [Planctomycetota bacterium]
MKTIISLGSENENTWQMNFCNWRCGEHKGFHNQPMDDSWVAAEVPGDIHLDAERVGIIEDPFYASNTDACIWMEEKDWWYRLEFTAPEIGAGQEKTAGQEIFLHCVGLDTFATVYLNGEIIGQNQNMFTPLRIAVGELLHMGANTLVIVCASAVFSASIDQPMTVNGNAPMQRLTTRKAQACYGWDIAPRLVTAGIWRAIQLEIVDAVEFDYVQLRTLGIADGRADIELTADIINHADEACEVSVQWQIAGQDINIAVHCQPGKNTVRQSCQLEDVHLWWPWNHGTPYLYDYQLTLRSGDRHCDVREGQFGVRTIVCEELPIGDNEKTFCFLVNGKRIFLKGMNWTPADAIYARIDHQRYDQLLQITVDSEINTLRIWGGGIYEDDYFYQQCDQRGILVWQDFMYACGCYPQDEEFLQTAREEAIHIVRSLSSYACMFAFCGDNENDWLAPEYGVPQYKEYPLSKEVLSSVVEEYAPHIPYVATSPFSNFSDDQNADNDGDVH